MDRKNNLKLSKLKGKTSILKKFNFKWVVNITFITFILTIALSFFSEAFLRNAEISIAFIILVIIVFIGIIFDLIGISVATAKIEPFNAMASNKISSARFAIKLIKNAGPVSNFCNDVIGDICGIISGAAAAIIILQLSNQLSPSNMGILSIVLSGLVASLTVGGKAIGKEIALKKSKEIVYFVARILYWINNKLHIDILPENTKTKKKR